jgi:four helix bundle protein
MNKSYRDLVAWQEAMDLVTAIYEITASFPKEELYGVTSQLRRAAVSIPSNIAEGQGRHGVAEFRHFLRQASGSLMEVETSPNACVTSPTSQQIGFWGAAQKQAEY